jgi:Glycosyl transferase family 2
MELEYLAGIVRQQTRLKRDTRIRSGVVVSAKQRIHLYCLCWNDARMLPFFFRHYDPVVDRYVILDNGSTDRSLQLLEEHPKVTVRHFDVSGDSFVEEEQRLSDTVWHESRGIADWVIVVDIDEHVFHPDLAGYLRRCTESEVTALRAIGYEMVADEFPEAQLPLVESVPLGVRSAGHDKLCIFNPDAVTQTCYAPGRHLAEPTGTVSWPEHPEILLLHYKQLGVDYAIRRSAELRLGLGPGDVEQGWGRQYLWSPAEIADKWSEMRAAAAPVPGLGSLRHVEPAYYDEEHVVAESGLFDADWYLAAYPDIQSAGVNALSHFCIHGWREDRKPNFYFDTSWYLADHPEVQATGQNPLLHYIRDGEREGAQPSLQFEPEWYREQYGLSETDSPLQHYLLHRASGRVSPNPEFDVIEYCRQRPPLEAELQDPFEEHWTSNAPDFRQEAGTVPAFDEVLSQLGIDPEADFDAATVPLSAVLEVLKMFLDTVVVDEDRYCRAYPDVAAAIERGTLESARLHFVESGYFEGRSPCPEAPDES